MSFQSGLAALYHADTLPGVLPGRCHASQTLPQLATQDTCLIHHLASSHPCMDSGTRDTFSIGASTKTSITVKTRDSVVEHMRWFSDRIRQGGRTFTAYSIHDDACTLGLIVICDVLVEHIRQFLVMDGIHLHLHADIMPSIPKMIAFASVVEEMMQGSQSRLRSRMLCTRSPRGTVQHRGFSRV